MLKLKFNKIIILVIIALIIGPLIGAGIVYLLNQREVQNTISKEEVREKILRIINQPEGEVTEPLIEVKTERGLYKVTINLQGQEEVVYITKDGVLLFPQAINFAELLAAQAPEQPTQEQLTGLAKCLTEKGVKFFGTHWCPACDRQKEMFGTAVQYLPYVECAEDRGSEESLALCQEAGVSSVPDWRFPDDRQELGMLSLERLSQLSGCPLL